MGRLGTGLPVRLGIVIPTIAGREESLGRTISAYMASSGDGAVLEVIKNQPSWPAACNVGRRALAGRADILHFGADDLVPQPGWLEPCLPVLEAGELPAPRVWNHEREGIPWSEPLDGEPGSLTDFTRVPILTAAMAEQIGDWPEIVYYADCWVSAKARSLGWPTRVVAGYDFVHHWHPVGRLDGDVAALEAARDFYLVEVERLGAM